MLYKYCIAFRIQRSLLKQDPIQLCYMSRTQHLLEEEVPRARQAVGISFSGNWNAYLDTSQKPTHKQLEEKQLEVGGWL